ncbi:hypothetical protein CV770_24750 [Bradyrhizobium sp. AC87j1]|nr:hypothetical protein CV770_24750 [Bradyrhizobium sp. AC87j1]
MPGPVPGIHVLRAPGSKAVDGRDEPGHDGKIPLIFQCPFYCAWGCFRGFKVPLLEPEVPKIAPDFRRFH